MPTDLFYDLKIKELSYGVPKRNKRGGYSVYVQKDKASPENFRFQMCDDDAAKPRMPFGVREPYDPSADPTRKTLELTVDDSRLQEYIRELDEKNIQMAVDNSEAWFRKKLSSEVIRTLYKTIMSEPSKEGYSPLFRCKVTPRSNVFVYHEGDDGEPTYSKGSVDDLTPGTEVLPIVECTGLWFMAKQFGMGFEAKDLLVYPKQSRKAFDFTFKGQRPVQTTETAQGGGEDNRRAYADADEESTVGHDKSAFDEIDANFGTMEVPAH